MSTLTSPLSAADLAELSSIGIGREEAERQLALLLSPPPPTRLLRACAVGDGIVRLAPGEGAALLARAERAALAGRFAKLVPASGAASRMFADLLAFLAEPDAATAPLARSRGIVAEVVARLEELALRPALVAALARQGETLDRLLARGDLATIARTLVAQPGLGLAALPKGLLPFHLYRDGARTAFAEHLVEGAGYLGDREGRCRLHFTIAPGSEPGFAHELARTRARSERRLESRFEVAFSHQSPATDTLALDDSGGPFRRADGSLLRRPGGHGALLENLERTEGELVFVKNIDNVVPERLQGEVVRWQKLLAGLALSFLERRDALWKRLDAMAPDESPEADLAAEARTLLRELGDPELSRPGGAGDRRPTVAELRARLDRPLRVCAVVPNTGEPGGGPFWVAGADGRESRQIVESAQVDLTRPDQAAAWKGSTHFNPVQLVCALDDPCGRRYELARFVDPEAVFIARKSEGGRSLVALERPGLWNGAMAHWHTLFVEVPLAVFAPVKTLLDLARPEHQVVEPTRAKRA